MGSGGSPNSDSHVERRRLSASLSFEYLAASPAVMEAAAALWVQETHRDHRTAS